MWTILPREPDLSRLYDPLSNWTKLDLFERHLEPDTWSITGPLDKLEFFKEGAGSILFSNGEQVASGELIDIEASSSVDVEGRKQESITATFASDFIVLGDRNVIPNPNSLLPNGSMFSLPAAYDSRNGPIETVILDYINAHIGPVATSLREMTRLRIPASLGRGGSTSVTARFDNLGTLVSSLAEAGNLRINVVHTEDAGGTWLDVVIEPVADLSAEVRFGTSARTSAGRITDWSWRRSRPTATRVLVLGGGTLGARDLLQLTNSSAETLWNRVIETTIDQRQVDQTDPNKLAELTREAQKALDEGAGKVEVKFTPRLRSNVVYRRDVKIGDIVGYDLPRLPPGKEKIRQVRTEVSVGNGVTEKITITVGSPDVLDDPIGGQTDRALREVNAIERNQ